MLGEGYLGGHGGEEGVMDQRCADSEERTQRGILLWSCSCGAVLAFMTAVMNVEGHGDTGCVIFSR